LIVAHDSNQRVRRPAAQVVKIELRDQRGRNILFAMPAQPGCVKDVALKFHKPHGAEPEFPQCARGMQQVQMRRQLWHGDGARHRETALKKRPIE